MDSSSDVATMDLTAPPSDTQTSSSNDDKISCTIKTKIGRHGLEQHYEDFKEYLTGDLKGKTSAPCILCKETVWHLKNSTSNYSRHFNVSIKLNLIYGQIMYPKKKRLITR